MKQYVIKTKAGSKYMITWMVNGEVWFGAILARPNSVASRFMDSMYRIEPIDMPPVVGECLSICGHMDEKAFPASGGWVRTTPIVEVRVL